MPKFDVNEQVTQRKSVKPDPALNDLVLLKLNHVNVESKEQELDPSKAPEMQSEYAGMKVPRIFYEFEQMYLPNSQLQKEGAQRFYVFMQSPIVSLKNTENPGEERQKQEGEVLNSLYSEMFKHQKHIHDAFIGTPNYKPIKSLPAIDENATAEERLKQTEKFFNAFADAFNKGLNDKPVFVNSDGNPIPLVAKLIVNKGQRRLEFPKFTNKGFIEKAKYNEGKVVTSLEIYGVETTKLPEKGSSSSTIETGDNPPAGNLKSLLDNIQ